MPGCRLVRLLLGAAVATMSAALAAPDGELAAGEPTTGEPATGQAAPRAAGAPPGDDAEVGGFESQPGPGAPFAVVELFTSEGCSSCPPADAFLADLIETARESGQRVFGLAFHVDYWNYIGWTDPFSSSDWSDRQRRYAHALEARQIYTPQLVVNGRRHGVGSDEKKVYKALGLADIPPELREDRGEVELAQKGNVPKLLELNDIKGDLHVHPDWSEGVSSIEDMVEDTRGVGDS